MQDKIALATIATIFLIFGLCYSYYTPLWNPPDEERHFAYCEYIAQHHTLPPLTIDHHAVSITQAIHPPLYYLIASLFCSDGGGPIQERILVNDGPGFTTISHPQYETNFPYTGKAKEAYLIRLFSLVLSTTNICFIYLIVCVLFPGNTALASATALFAAMNPQFLHISVSVSNENLSDALSTIYLFALLRYIKADVRTPHHMVTGMLLGCCLLSKTATLFYIPLTAVLIAWSYLRNRRRLIESVSLIFSVATLVAGWWYLRNWLVFNDPFASKLLMTTQIWSVRRVPLTVSDVTKILSNTFVSFFGNFGAFQIPLPKMYLSIYGGMMVLALTGLFWMLRKKTFTVFQRQSFFLLSLSLLGGVGIFILLNTKYVGVYMGRYLYIVIAPIGLFTCMGVSSLFPQRLRNAALIALSFLLIILNLNILLRVLKPAYANTELAEGANQPLFSYPTAEFRETTTVSQTFVSTENNLCAVRVMLSSPQKIKKGALVFTIKEGKTQENVLQQITLPLKDMDDFSRYFFIFPPLADSKGKEYTFCCSSPSLPPESRISLWYEPHDVYPEGEMLVNGEPASGDLYFTAYSFIGENPKTVWQGTKETVITQGLYIGIRELQLYYERSKTFREKTITHEKLLRLETAIHNRSILTEQGTR